MNSENEPIKARTVRCPRCGGPSMYSPQNHCRPFCSPRCKLGDLGRWASEEFRLPDASPPDSDSSYPQ